MMKKVYSIRPKNLTFSDLVNIAEVQEMIDTFYDINKTPMTILDNANNVLAKAGWSRICTHFHRKNRYTGRLCYESNLEITNLLDKREPVELQCKNGLTDIAYPIIIEGEFLATILLGQFFYKGEEPDKETYLKRAELYGFDSAKYSEAFDKIPRFTRSQTNKVMAFYMQFAEMLAKQGLANLKLKEEILCRQQAEKELKAVTNDQNTILNNVRALIFYKDTQNNIIRVTESVARSTGLGRSEIEGMPSVKIYPETADRYYKDDLEVIESQKPKLGIIEPLPTKNGGLKWLLTDKIPVIQNGLTSGIIAFSIDITDRIITENKLQESEAKFRHIAKNTPTAILIYQNNKWVFTNDAAVDISGYSKDELMTMNFWEFLHSDEIPLMKKLGMERQQGKLTSKSRYELRIITKKGEVKWVDLAGSQILYHGKQAGIISLIDITENKAIEAALNKARIKAEESDALKSAFLANLSHEIRTPLNGIIGFSEILANELVDTPASLNYANIIKQSGENLLETVNDIIDISFIQTNQMKFEPEEINISSLLLDIKAQYDENNLYDSSKHTFVLRLPENKKTQIFTDAYNFKKALSKILCNAFRYSNHGTVELGLEKIKGLKYRIYVKDEGVGIDEELQKQMYDYFKQFDTNRKLNNDGLGLGLPIAKGLLQNMGFKLNYEPNKPKGSVFFFYCNVINK